MGYKMSDSTVLREMAWRGVQERGREAQQETHTVFRGAVIDASAPSSSKSTFSTESPLGSQNRVRSAQPACPSPRHHSLHILYVCLPGQPVRIQTLFVCESSEPSTRWEHLNHSARGRAVRLEQDGEGGVGDGGVVNLEEVIQLLRAM